MRTVLNVAAVVVALVAGVAAQEQRPYKVGEDGVKAPVLVKDVHPTYTQSARDRHVQGHVELSAIVKADGSVGTVTVTTSLDPDLDQQAVNAAKQWQFKPGTKDGKAVDVECQIEMTFTLK